MHRCLEPTWFNRSTLEAARELLGMHLCRRMPNGEVVRLTIHETEAYNGSEDRACHASRGQTPRNAVMFGPAGHYYIYLCYGIHWLLNIVTGPIDYPAAILLRGAGEANGPGKLTRHLSINQTQNHLPVAKENGLWVESDGTRVLNKQIRRTPRIGVSYAGPHWSQVPYRFVWDAPQEANYASSSGK